MKPTHLAVREPADPACPANNLVSIPSRCLPPQPGDESGPGAIMAEDVDALLPLLAQLAARSLLECRASHDASAVLDVPQGSRRRYVRCMAEDVEVLEGLSG